MPGTQGSAIHGPKQGFPHPELVLNAIQRPYSRLITAFFHYYHRPTYIRFKDMAPSDSNNSLPRLDLTPRIRRLMLDALNEPDLDHPRRPGVR
jgi:hypothetical protein